MNVFTYHEELEGYPDCKELLLLWSASWRRHGWTPIILGREQAEAHRLYARLNAAVVKLPAANAVAYETSCYLRWLALAQVGGGLMVDTDVINYGYRPRDLVCPCCPLAMPSKPISLEPHKVPCSIFASDKSCETFAHSFIYAGEHSEGMEATSDMKILVIMNMEIRPIVVSVYAPGWKEAYLVHYAWKAIFDVTGIRPVIKLDIIKKERPL